MTTATQPTHDARAIANYILDRAPAMGIEKVTLMQLLKLVYLSHGWSFAFHDAPLVAQNPQAWQYGPVYPHIYKALNHSGSAPIVEKIRDKISGFEYYPIEMTLEQQKLIDAVLQSYGKRHAFELSTITHSPDGPWERTMKTAGVYKEIPPTELKSHYQQLRSERGITSL